MKRKHVEENDNYTKTEKKTRTKTSERDYLVYVVTGTVDSIKLVQIMESRHFSRVKVRKNSNSPLITQYHSRTSVTQTLSNTLFDLPINLATFSNN